MAITAGNPVWPTTGSGSAVGEPEPTTITFGGGYVLEGTVGDGPRGTALLARGAVSGNRVLVTLLPDQVATDAAVRARFSRAADLALRLSHPNVVRVLDAGIDGRPFVVTEYVEGETLADRLARRGRLAGAETLTLATHLAAGLAHAHGNGVVHGRLDADSILLGADGVARVCDFWLGRILDDGRTGPVDPAADMYSLGVVLREAGGNDLPPGLVAIVDAALAPHPAVRPLAVDVLHQLLTMTGSPTAWIAPATASVWNTGDQV